MTYRTHVTLVADRSGSMGNLATEASGSINNFINEQAQSDVADFVTVTLIEFDDRINTVFGPVQVQEAPIYNLLPRGMTALNDAIHLAIVDTQTWIDSLPENEQPDKVIISITTDGFENSSQEVTRAEVKELIEQKTEAGWDFVFMASNLDDVQQTAQGYAIGKFSQMDHTADGYNSSYTMLSTAVRSASTTGTLTWDNTSNPGGNTKE